MEREEMRIVSGIFSIILLAFTAGVATAQSAIPDTMENRHELAKRYAAIAFPLMLRDIEAASAKNIPAGPQRDAYRQKIRGLQTTENMNETMVPAMVRNFTADEIEALVDFYSSPIRISIMKKFPGYLADVQPGIVRLVLQSLQRQ